MSRFRSKYRELTPAEKELVDAIKAQAEVLEKLYDKALAMHPGRYPALAMTDLEKSIMWIVKGLTG